MPYAPRSQRMLPRVGEKSFFVDNIALPRKTFEFTFTQYSREISLGKQCDFTQGTVFVCFFLEFSQVPGYAYTPIYVSRIGLAAKAKEVIFPLKIFNPKPGRLVMVFIKQNVYVY